MSSKSYAKQNSQKMTKRPLQSTEINRTQVPKLLYHKTMENQIKTTITISG